MPRNVNNGTSRLAESAYDSPYSRSGAPDTHPTGDPYAPLRARALSTLEAMGYDPRTMIERGVLWAEDQDPFGHVKQAKFMEILGIGFHRTMESYDEYMEEEEYEDMLNARTIIPVIHKYDLEIRRQVKYPDSLIVANRPEQMEPTRYYGTTSLFSLKQQAIVAEVKGHVTFVNAKTGRPVDIRSVGTGWLRVYEGYLEKVKLAQSLKQKWEEAKQKKTEAKANPKM